MDALLRVVIAGISVVIAYLLAWLVFGWVGMAVEAIAPESQRGIGIFVGFAFGVLAFLWMVRGCYRVMSGWWR